MNAIVDLTPTEPTQRTMPAVMTPAALLQIALESGADLDRLERLMGMQERYEANEARKAMNVAFAQWKAEAVKIIKTKKVLDGPLKGKLHAELSAIVDAVTPSLSSFGLSVSWRLIEDTKDWMRVECVLKHAGGHSESVAMGGAPDTGPGRNAIQARASTKTYLERYTLMAILGLAAGDDDGAGGGHEEDEVLLTSFRDAAMAGTESLQKHFEATKPPADFWKRNSEALKAAAAKADKVPT
jgi:hypothetical protein